MVEVFCSQGFRVTNQTTARVRECQEDAVEAGNPKQSAIEEAIEAEVVEESTGNFEVVHRTCGRQHSPTTTLTNALHEDARELESADEDDNEAAVVSHNQVAQAGQEDAAQGSAQI